jgi:predicted unusual protein kinase regulating ubiquinone biosynthesis (AarF/ABC1/UbiB family)
VNQILIEEFGQGALETFASFDETPIASASIGQVHRASLHDGTVVAVKVQHKGIEEAVESDLKNISMLESIVDLAGPRGMKAGPLFNEVLLRFRQELDYRIEAKNQNAFRQLHNDYADIHIPEVYAPFSTRRVLTTRFVEGVTLEEARVAPEWLRRRYAQAMWRFVFRGNLVGGAFNADPHPGNYLFDDTGRVTFLDFGCVQPILDTTRLAAASAHTAVMTGDQASFEDSVAKMLGTKGGQFGIAALEYSRRCFEPLTEPNYRITPKYAAELFSEVRSMKKAMLAKDRSFVAPPPQLALMNRLQFGFYSVLAQLDVEVNYQEVEQSFLEEARSLSKGRVSSILLDPS